MGSKRVDVDLNFLNLSRILQLPDGTASGHAATYDQIQALQSQIDALAGGISAPQGIDCSANPNYPAAVTGDNYYVTVAGKIGGASGVNVEVGDWIVCKSDTVAGNHATVGSNFFIVQRNVEQATETIVGLTRYATQAEAQAALLNTVALTPLGLAQYLTNANIGVPFTQTIGNGVAQSFTITHNKNKLVNDVTVWDTVNSRIVLVEVIFNTVNQLTINTNSVPANNQYSVSVA